MIRYEFTDSSIRQEDIHPDFIFDTERKIAHDIVTNLAVSRDIQACPVCGTPRNEILFQKWGYQYAICPNTWTVCLASFPADEVLLNYFHHSDLSRFRASKEYQDVVSQKRKDIWENEIGWIEGRVNRYLGGEKYTVADWGSKFVGWTEFLQTGSFVDALFVQDPLPPIDESTESDGHADIACLINALQREMQPQKLLEKIARKLKPEGLLFVSCRSGSGFDVLTLRENSESIFPLDHVFLPSPEGMDYLLKQAGFDVLEITTPGLMDMRYAQNAGKNIPVDQHFLRYIMEQKDELLLERMQGFLQRNNLSSYLRCVAKKR